MNILYNFNTSDAGQPSFFEMFIQNQMMPSLKPAIRYILAVLSQRTPQLAWSLKWSDELFYAALLVLERHHLLHYDGSFSENFYGFKRGKVMPDGKAQPLNDRQRMVSLFFLVGVPYLKDKLDKFYNSTFGRNSAHSFEYHSPPQDDPSQPAWKAKLKAVFKVLYPIFAASYEGLFFLYSLLYMYNHTIYFTPLLHLQGLTVKRLSMHDLVEQTRRVATEKMLRPKGTFQAFLMTILDAWHLLLDYSKYILPAGIFLFKFLEWWYSENRLTDTAVPIPPAPEPPKRALGGIPVPADKGVCPLCSKVRTNHAMPGSSGFVFCYPCIHNYVSLNQRCPVTLIPCTTDSIRKIYDEGK